MRNKLLEGCLSRRTRVEAEVLLRLKPLLLRWERSRSPRMIGQSKTSTATPAIIATLRASGGWQYQHNSSNSNNNNNNTNTNNNTNNNNNNS